MKEHEESTAVRVHLPCPDCGSHDALCEYSDGHTYCFSCNTYHGAERTCVFYEENYTARGYEVRLSES